MKALVSGCNGQDGSYLAELLLEKGYEVFGMVRRQSNENLENIVHLLDKIKIVHGDLTDQTSLIDIISSVKPDEIYNMAAQSHVQVSWEQPDLTCTVNALGILRLLEAIRKVNKNIKIIQASSSEMFGRVLSIPQNENTNFNPVSPYACSKVFAYNIIRTYRFSYGMFACNAISFNHTSPHRGKEFVTRKVSLGIAKIKLGISDKIYLGNIDAKRDWSHAKDIVHGMYLIMQHKVPDDFVLASGETHSVREFIEEAFKVAEIKNWQDYIVIDEKFIRPAEVNILLGDSSKARKILGWIPKVAFKELVKEMVLSDIKELKKSIDRI